ncbi:hypothetical protein KRR38_11005 [Novosphingobium sp. G106]|uniref:hypothetical protein n=1 Tax=Novosphingobium sp. G106 TaxID=2849500 RepID=UPI001C2D32E3|nr:hypothetical protein [Novosphingobium sp. G106]MBV1688187.1 hypothetical protein [Novosphingobium sp. G106]
MSQAYHEMAAASVFDRMRNQAGAMNSLASQLRDRFAKVRTVSFALLAAGAVLFGLGLAQF